MVQYEKNPITPHLVRTTAPYDLIKCIGERGEKTPRSLKQLIRKSLRSNKALKLVEDALFSNKDIKALVGTTQAVDLIGGGVKVNALPETAYAVVNHRIAAER